MGTGRRGYSRAQGSKRGAPRRLLGCVEVKPVPLLLSLFVLVPAGLSGAADMVDASPDAIIVRDDYGVPHIWADDLYSLFWANGYAQAQDRLVQMEILRHVGKGELASLTGGYGSLDMDLATRRELYTEEERQATIERIGAMTPENGGLDGAMWLEGFNAFADGVNAWIEETRTDPSKLPGEYAAFGVLPRDWLVSDTIAIAEYLLDIFGRGSGGAEHRNAALLAQLQGLLGDEQGAAAFEDFVPGQRDSTYTTIAAVDLNPGHGIDKWDYTQVMSFHDLSEPSALDPAQQEAMAASQATGLDDFMGLQETLVAAGFPLKFGSNAQVIDKRFAANGENILYGGPQMAYFAPMIPYEVALHGAGFEATGMGVAGAPGVIIGRGPTHSWTVTSGSSDQVDMVVERLVPGNGEQYYLDGEVVDMDCRTETHYVKPAISDFAVVADGRAPDVDIVEQRVCRTVHGPVLARSDDGQYAFASQRAYRGDEARSGILWLQIGQTRSIADIQDLLETFRFSFNFNIAEDGAEGSIGYLHVGVQPRRDARLDSRLPTPGWDSSYTWDHTDPAQVLTGSDLPHMIDSPKGYTVNWNNNPAKGFPTGDNMEKWGNMQRAELMEELLLERIDEKSPAGLTVADMRDIHFQASTSDPYGDEFYAIMKAAIYGPDGMLDAQEAAALAALAEWKDTGFFYGGYAADNNGVPIWGGKFATTMPDGMGLFEAWRDAMQERVYADELGAGARSLSWSPLAHSDGHAADHGTEGNKHSVLADAMAGGTGHAWCDDVTTPGVESCQDQANAAMADVLAAEDWQGRPNHISKFSALGALPSYEIPMTNRPSFQAFYDWGLMDTDPLAASRNVLPPGNSGHMNSVQMAQVLGEGEGWPRTPLFPAHAEDQLQMYVDFQDKPLMFERIHVDAVAESCTHVNGALRLPCI